MVFKTPLKWPDATPRTANRRDGRFGAKAASGIGYRSLTVPQALDRLANELRRLGVTDMESQAIVMTAMKPAFSGATIPDQGQPKDPGVVVRWEVDGKERVMAVDIYNRTADNIAAIAAVLDYLRGVERHGGTFVQQQALSAFDALPPPDSCWKILGIDREVARTKSPPMATQYIKDAFRIAAREGHANGGDMDRLARARDEALAEVAPK